MKSLPEVLAEAQRLGFLGPGPVDRHLTHAAGFVRCLPAGEFACLDLGSGGGVPGLVLAERCPGGRFVLLDSGRRRCRFLRQAVSALELTGRVEVVEARAEDAARLADLRGTHDVVVARSFGPPAVTAECAVAFLRPGGLLVVSEPPEPPAGERWPAGGLAALGFAPPAPCGDATARFVTLVRERLDDRWPRRVGIPAKRPLW
ncbi:MAG: 16S rRNA (guanine(527)-N(7))-methyltransferase RsmG [Acidimicrobiia bacterium]